MKKVKVDIKILGGLKHELNLERIKKWQTSFFEINSISNINSLPNTTTLNDWYYSDKQLKSIIGNMDNSQVVFGLINHELEDNYYGRRIGTNCYILSLYETGEIVLNNDLKIEHFVIQNLYFVAALYYRYGGIIPLSESMLTHQDIRGCLFDFNAHKEDIVYSLGKVSICSKCEADFDSSLVPENFVSNISKELKKIRKSRYFILRDFIRKSPILSIIISAFLALVLNILASYAYSFLTKPPNQIKLKTETKPDSLIKAGRLKP